MKVKELTAYIAQKMAEGKLREDSEVLIGSDEFGGLYIYSPDKFHMVCMSDADNYYRSEVQDELESYKRIQAKNPDCEWVKKDLVEQTERVRKVNAEWKDALVI